nr:MAG TPA: hypothetical protein [Caudoviricetes sp.]
MWGCFHIFIMKSAAGIVFPTHVGVFLFSSCSDARSVCLPHACGGVSENALDHRTHAESSPRMWGCFWADYAKKDDSEVFPTHVGVFLMKTLPRLQSSSLPHACGGVSLPFGLPVTLGKSSPRMWGCFFPEPSKGFLCSVFPTHVGVFLWRTGWDSNPRSLPHACGGVSAYSEFRVVQYVSSPRMWGQFSSRTTYQRRAFHALGHIQQELRDGQAPRTPDLEKPFQTIPPPGILLGGHAGSPARGRHGFKPCPFRRSWRGQRPPFRHGRRGGRSFPCALPPMSDGSAPPGISTGSILAVRRRQERSPAHLKILPPPPLQPVLGVHAYPAFHPCGQFFMLRSRSTGGADDDGHQLRGLARSRKPHIRRFRLPAPVAVGIPERLEVGKSLPGKPTPFCRDVKSLSAVNAAPRWATRDRGNALNRRSLAFRFRHGLPSPSRCAGQRYGFPLSHRIGESALTHSRIVRCGREFFSCLLIFFDRVGRL